MNEYINAAKQLYIQAVNVVSYTKRGYLEEKKKSAFVHGLYLVLRPISIYLKGV